jgi:hypothetical protein
MYQQFSFATDEIKLHYIMELTLADEEALLIFLHFPSSSIREGTVATLGCHNTGTPPSPPQPRVA